MSGRRWAPVAAGLLLVAAGPAGRAASPDAAPVGSTPLAFRRILVPADQIAELAQGCLPIKRSEFVQLVEAAPGADTGPPQDVGARIEQATYWARFDRGRLVDGNARLEVVHAGADMAVLPLSPCGLAMGDSVWEGESTGEAAVGRAPGGELVALVERSSVLRFPWSLRGSQSPLGETRFDIRLPASPVNRMILWLPEAMIPVPDHGAVSQLPEGEGAEAEWASGFGPPPGVDSASEVAWLLEIGADSRLALRVTPRDVFHRNRPLVLLQTATTYRCTPAGLDLSADLHLDVYHAPIRQLTLRLDPSIQLTAVRFGDSPLPLAASELKGDGVRRVVVEFPEPVLGPGRTIRLSALAPLRMGQRTRLPTIGLEGVFWQQSSAALEVPESLLLRELETRGCRQSRVGPLPAPDSGEQRRFQFYSSDASIDVVVDRRPPSLRIRMGTTIELSAAAPTARVACDVESIYGESFRLQAETSRRWIIDAVETVPADAIDEYDVAPRPPNRQLLWVSLKRAVSPGRRLRLIVHVHRRTASSEPELDYRSFRVLDFQDVANSRDLTAVNVKGPYRTSLSRDGELTRLEPQDLSLEDRELIQPGADSLIFVDDPTARNLRIRQESRPPRYAAEVAVDASIQIESLTESYRIRCTPDASPVDRLLVRLSQARKTPAQWSLLEESGQPISARRLDSPRGQAVGDDDSQGVGDDGNSPGDDSGGGELWEIDLHRARSTEFELRATRSTPLSEKTAISLASLPEAASQTGVLTVRSLDGQALQIQKSGVESLPPTPPAPDRYSNVRAQCRYDPSQDARVMVSRASDGAATTSVWAWSCDITSRFSTSGRASHEIVYRLENTGRPQVRLRTTAGLRVDRLVVDDADVPVPALEGEALALAAPLPPGHRFPTVRLRCSESPGDLGIFDTVYGPDVGIDVPVLAKRWTVWLPPRYESRSDPRLLGDSAVDSDWTQRLLGPLRSAGPDARFRLFPSVWGARGRSGDIALTRAAQADQLLQLLGELLESSDAGSGDRMTWGQLLTGYLRWTEKEYSAAPPRLWIDQTELASRGITASTSVESEAGVTGRDRGVALLERFNLALGAHSEGLLLCSDATLAASGQPVRRGRGDVVAWIPEGRLLDQFAGDASDRSRFLSIEAWTAEPLAPESPWRAARPAPFSSVAEAGWTACVMDLAPGEAGRMPVYRPAAMHALGWALFLAAAGLGMWRGASQRGRLLWMAASAAVAAILLPAAYVPPARGVFLGALTAGLLLAVTRRAAVASPTRGAPSASTHRARAVGALILLLCVAGLGTLLASMERASGADPGKPEARRTPNIVRLLIPVDARQQPVGEYVYVPRAAYDQLHRQAAADDRSLRPWLLRSARYEGELTWASEGTRLDIHQLTATFYLTVFQAGSRVAIPLGRSGVQLVQARLDGGSAAIHWSSDNRDLLVDVETTGEHRLDVVLRPMMRTDGRTTGLHLDVPPLAAAELRLAAPADASGIRFPSSLGARSVETETGRLISQLGPTRRLTVQWPTDPGLGVEPAQLEAEEYLWLKIRPGSVVLDANFRFLVRAGRVNELQVLADPHLRPLPLRDDQPVTGFVQTVDGDVTTIHWELADPVEDEIVLRTSFYMSGTSGVGHFRLPRLQPVADRTVRRWLGVSVDPSLKYEGVGEPPLDRIDATEFAAVWGGASEPPLRAWKLPEGDVQWSVATSFHEPHTTADQELDVSVTRDAMNVGFQARLNTTGEGRFQVRLRAPTDLRVQSVSLMEDDEERFVRFSRSPSGAVILFLSDQVSGEQQLTLRGVAPLSKYARTRLPQISVDGAELQAYRVCVYRQPEVLVRLESVRGLDATPDAPLGEHQPGRGRLVASLHAPKAPAQSPAPSVTLIATTNRARLEGRLVTRLRRTRQRWTADADYRVRTAQGLIDSLRLEIPDGWNEPFRLDPPADYEVAPGPAGRPRRLLIRPRLAESESYRIRIHSPLDPPRDAQFGQLLDVSPLDTRRVKRLLVLPTRVAEQETAWETSGLQADSLPDNDFIRGPQADSPVCYQVVGPRFQAAITQVAPVTGAPQVWLADIHLARLPEGFVQGVATFDLDPAGIDRCSLQLPPGMQLVHVRRDGSPASILRKEDSRWDLQLASNRLAQRIEVLFAGRLESLIQPGGNPVLLAPQLANLPVERTLWTIFSAPQLGVLAPNPSASRVDALRQDMFRFGTATMLVERACDTSSDMGIDERKDWYAPWARRLVAFQGSISRDLLGPPHDDAFGAPEMSGMVQRHEEAAEQLGAEDVLREAAAQAEAAAGPVQLWQLASAPRGSPLRCVFQGPADRVTLGGPRHAFGPWPQRAGLAAAALCLAVLIRLLETRGSLGEWLARWPHFALVLAGLAWWLWLTPSFLGWILIAAGLVASARPPWRTVSEPA